MKIFKFVFMAIAMKYCTQCMNNALQDWPTFWSIWIKGGRRLHDILFLFDLVQKIFCTSLCKIKIRWYRSGKKF